jgi:predicted DNA-binding antitoxin AbrB/MazE fold protein
VPEYHVVIKPSAAKELDRLPVTVVARIAAMIESLAQIPRPHNVWWRRGIIESRRNVMTIDVDAVYENGILTLKHPVDLPENAEVHVTIQTAAEVRTPLGRRLRELRAEIARSGMAPLGWDEIESEVAVRRGGWREGS